jgi:GT2 family glycosyltransferase
MARPCHPLHFTIAVLCYGGHTHLAERFFTKLYHYTDPQRFTLRVGLNEVVPATLKLVQQHAARFGNIEIYEEPKNVFKSPLMRRMFYEKPLTTEWIIWFDDDSHVTRGDWLQRLALKVEREPAVDQWGRGFALWQRGEKIVKFVQAASWYRGLPLMREADLEGHDATKFLFVTGGFWAMKTAAIRALDWPDRRLIQANDDFLLGEALRQNRCGIGMFEYGVEINDAPRRNGEAPEVEHLPSP